MGPIYHLSTDKDRRQCISECIRVLKKDGVLAIAYLNKHAAFMYQFKSDKDFIKDEASRNIIDVGHFYEDDSDNFYFTTSRDVERMLSDYNVQSVTNVATDGIGYLLKDTIESSDEEEYRPWVENHLRTCTEPSLIGYSLHALLVCRKI